MAEKPTRTHLVIDGSNIATEGRSLPSLQQLDEAVRALLEERPHETWTVVVDATFGHRIESPEKQMYEEALAANELVTPPAGTIGRGDKFLLEIADRANATVFSNDSFQEFHGEYEWLFDEGRLIGGKPVPEVGWIFTARTPVRGPRSRMASRVASERRGRSSASRGSRRVLSPTEPLPVPTRPPPRVPRRRQISAASVAASTASTPEVDDEVAPPSRAGRSSRSRQSSSPSVEAVNEPLPFIEFIAEYGPGSVVKGEVVSFTSHGAFVQVGDVRCYLALKLMGDPAPRSARDVLPRGEIRDFVVHALDAPRRGIDLALPPGQEIVSHIAEADEPPMEQPRRARRTRQAPPVIEEAGVADAPVADPEAPRRRRVRKAPAVAFESSDVGVSDVADGAPDADRGGDDVGAGAEIFGAGDAVDEGLTPAAAPKKAATRKAAAKKAPAKKAAAKKAVAKKSVVAMPATEEESAVPPVPTSEESDAPPKKVAAKKKAVAKKAPAKKAPAKKAPTKKASATKAPAKKAAPRKPATKRAATKEPAPSDEGVEGGQGS
ncbi:MAG: S1 RNA-binding domain-containing protein [Actinomycetota bacterium]|nr:S1 RNA-binding domain-containing protein [Actinomycetota bacterium]